MRDLVCDSKNTRLRYYGSYKCKWHHRFLLYQFALAMKFTAIDLSDVNLYKTFFDCIFSLISGFQLW